MRFGSYVSQALLLTELIYIQETEEPVIQKQALSIQLRNENLYWPISAIFRVVQCGLNTAVRLHILMHFWGYEGPRVLIGEGLALTVGAFRAQVRAVCHLILLQKWKQGSKHIMECPSITEQIIQTDLDLQGVSSK